MSAKSFFAKKRVLITGINGFIGSRLAERLVGEKADVCGIISPESRKENIAGFENSLTLKVCDLRVAGDISKIAAAFKPQIIYHTASYGNHPQHYDASHMPDVLKIMETNVMGTANLLQACRSLNFECFVNAGSAFAEYGPSSEPMVETQPLAPITFYGASKAAATHLCSVSARNTKKKILTLRPLYVYGPGEWLYRFIPTVIANGLKGEVVPLTSLKETKSFVFIDDVINAFLLAAVKDTHDVSVINIGSSEELTLGDVIRIVEKCIKKPISYKEGEYKALQWPSVCWASNNQLAQKVLGWAPETNLEAGIKQTIEWLRSRLDKSKISG